MSDQEKGFRVPEAAPRIMRVKPDARSPSLYP